MEESTRNAIQPAELLELIDKAIELNDKYYEALSLIGDAVLNLKIQDSNHHPFYWHPAIYDAGHDCCIHSEPLQKMRDKVEFQMGQSAVYIRKTQEEINKEVLERLQEIEDAGF